MESSKRMSENTQIDVEQSDVECQCEGMEIDQSCSLKEDQRLVVPVDGYIKEHNEQENKQEGENDVDLKRMEAMLDEARHIQQENKQEGENDVDLKRMEAMLDEARSELEQEKKKHQVFRDRMSIVASVEIGTSGEVFEEISNPSRESELRQSYNKLKMTMWPKCLQEIENKCKASKETVDKKEEKEAVKRMIKKVFTKAANDMMIKKSAIESEFFKISDGTGKRRKCIEMAVQSLQLLIFWEDCTHYQDMYKELGRNSPDYLCEFADQCYKLGCLMALHNPPLSLDLENKDSECPFPPIIKKQRTLT